MEKLTSKELDTLIDALDAWEERKPSADGLIGQLMSSVIEADSHEEAKAKIELKIEEARRRWQREEKDRKELAILLKAKLVNMKHDLAIEAAMPKEGQPQA